MRNFLLGALLLLSVGIFYGFEKPFPTEEKTKDPTVAIKWYTWEEAMAASKKKPKKIFIDLYTNWCGWCKRMDKNTFSDPTVATYINKHFYPVKFNGEYKESVKYKGYTLKYIPSGTRGYHEMAYALLDGQIRYPATVYLDEKQDRISISPGYKAPADIMYELKFVAEGHYIHKTYEQYKRSLD